ncbi:COUP transcription factor 2 [Aphelenchoides avenae]|nr:COUP transcription factor 2 [Aphelenchus avenae]
MFQEVVRAETLIQLKENMANLFRDATAQQHWLRLLLSAVDFIKYLLNAVEVPAKDRLALATESWSQIFVLTALRCGTAAVKEALANDSALSQDISQPELESLTRQLTRLESLNMDLVECGSLKAISLLNPDIACMSTSETVDSVRDRLQIALEDHCRQKLNQTGRFGRLLLAAAGLRCIQSSTIQRIFFASLGDASVESILREVFNAEDNVLHAKQET